MPPDQLLRQVFETAPDFASARQRLETTPIARPVIYTLAGCRPGERCVIERTVDGFTTRTENTGAANDWLVAAQRLGSAHRRRPSVHLRATTRPRRTAACGARRSRAWQAPFGGDVRLGRCRRCSTSYTRIAAEMCAARGILRVAGYEMMPGFDLPQQVTQLCEVRAEPDGRQSGVIGMIHHGHAALQQHVPHP